MIDVLKYIFLGFIQGISEVLPISSSGHLVIVSDILKMSDDSLTFEVFLHLASLLAILFFLRKKLFILIKGFFNYIFKRKEEDKIHFQYCLMIVISTIPVVLFTLIFKDLINSLSSKVFVVGILLIINGMMLWFLSKIQGIRKKEQLNYKDALVIGVFQCAGLFPGISRSGSCLSGAFSRKIDKEVAADYAFMLFIPAVLGATVLEIPNFSNLVFSSSTIVLYVISFLVTMVVTYFSFSLLLHIIKRGKISWFGYYCAVIGIIAIIYDLGW